jgi:hypothetical protein
MVAVSNFSGFARMPWALANRWPIPHSSGFVGHSRTFFERLALCSPGEHRGKRKSEEGPQPALEKRTALEILDSHSCSDRPCVTRHNAADQSRYGQGNGSCRWKRNDPLHLRQRQLRQSTCKDTCAQNWPPMVATRNATPWENWTILQRDDGSRMWAYKGKPLYTWKNDKVPGDTSGDGANEGTWHVAKP